MADKYSLNTGIKQTESYVDKPQKKNQPADIGKTQAEKQTLLQKKPSEESDGFF